MNFVIFIGSLYKRKYCVNQTLDSVTCYIFNHDDSIVVVDDDVGGGGAVADVISAGGAATFVVEETGVFNASPTLISSSFCCRNRLRIQHIDDPHCAYPGELE